MSAIDDIFSKKKTSGPKVTKPSIPPEPNPTKNTKKKHLKVSSADALKPAVQVIEFKEPSSSSAPKQDIPTDDGFGDSRGTSGKRRKIDELDLYSTEELNIGKGGDTEDCPFDCQCCY